MADLQSISLSSVIHGRGPDVCMWNGLLL